MKARVKTGVILTFIVLLFLYFSYIPYVLKLFAAVLNLVGIYELYRAAGCEKKSLPFFLSIFWGLGMPFFCSFIPWYSVIITITFGCAIVAFFPLAANIERLTFHTAGAAFCTSFLVSAFFSVIPILRMSKYGLYHIILVVLTSVVTEVSAYFVGRTFGKHRLIPKVSPGKTVEGFVGGIAISYLVILALGIITSHLTNTPIRYDIFSLYLILASVIGQIGDLTMSLIKRAAKIKDFGRLLPGHGGVLDRFDSQFFIAPFTLAFYTLVGQIF